MVTLLNETFWHQGRRHVRQMTLPAERYVLGVDLGQSTDPTAVCALHWRREPLDSFSVTEGSTVVLLQDCREYLDVRHLQRLPLGMAYPEQVQTVADLLSRPPLRGADLAIDETGVGRPVGDMFDQAGLAPVRVTITAGNSESEAGSRRWHVGKSQLVSLVDARLHSGELRFAAELQDAPILKDELRDFRRKLSDTGRASYAARAGAHDDLVLAVAIAVWAVQRPSQGEFSVGHVRGLVA
jgi:hypothetical protein